MYVFILQQENNTHIKLEGQQGPEALTAARNTLTLRAERQNAWMSTITMTA